MNTIDRRRFVSLSLGGVACSLIGGCSSESGGESSAESVALTNSETWSDGLPRSTPEAMGVSSGEILNFLTDLEKAGLELHSFMLMRKGHVLAEAYWSPFHADRVHMTHSLTKSVTATGVGLAIDEGRFGLDEKVVSFFPEFVPLDANDNIRAMTVRDLLTMQTGHDQMTSGSAWRPISTSWVAEFFKISTPYEPGTFFKYTSAASFMLSAIVTKTTNSTLEDYMRPRFFEPLGIDKLSWDLSPGGINSGGNGLSWTTVASLKLGALHAQMGEWNGNRILSPEWVKAATTQQSAENEEYGYGYHWWIGPGNTYSARGLFRQLTIVFPDHDATIALFSAISDGEKLYSLLWRYFPALFENGPIISPSVSDQSDLKSKKQKLSLLEPLQDTFNQDIEERVSGRKFTIGDNDQSVQWVSFEFTSEACIYRMKDDRGEHKIEAGRSEYVQQLTNMTGNRLHHQYQSNDMLVAAGAKWLDGDMLQMTWQFIETAFRDTVICRFEGDSVMIDRSVNLNTGEMNLPTLTGMLG